MSNTLTEPKVPDGYEACAWADADRSDLEGMRACLMRNASGEWVKGEEYPGGDRVPIRRIPLPQKPRPFCNDTYDLESDPCLDKALTELVEAKRHLRKLLAAEIPSADEVDAAKGFLNK